MKPRLADERCFQARSRVEDRPIYVPFLDFFRALNIRLIDVKLIPKWALIASAVIVVNHSGAFNSRQ